jgi:hypothetical protein
MSGRGKTAGSGKARAKAKTRSSRAGLQFPVVSFNSLKKRKILNIVYFKRVVFIVFFDVVIMPNVSVLVLQFTWVLFSNTYRLKFLN